jgi:hypothetical protein
MAARFWVGGAGNWDASTTTHWAATSGGAGGQSVPGSADIVTFDANSGTGTVTLTTSPTVVQVLSAAVSLFAGTLAMSTFTLTCNKASGVAFDARGIQTISAGTSTLLLSGLSPQFFGGGKTYNVLTATGTGQLFIGDTGNTLAALNYTGGATKISETLLLCNSCALTVTGTLTCHGNSNVNRVLVACQTGGVAVTITAGAVDFTNCDFEDITGLGAANWNLSAITGLSGDCQGNTNLTFTSPTTQHWISASGGNFSDVTKWTSRVPLPQDNTAYDCAFGTAQTITFDMRQAGKSMDWTGATWTTSLTWASTISTSIYGSIKLIAGLTITGAGIVVLRGRGSQTLQTFSVSSPRRHVWTCPGGTYSLQDDFTSTGRMDVNTGTLDCNGHNLTVGTFFGQESNIVGGGILHAENVTVTITGVGACWTIGTATSPIEMHMSGSTVKFTDTSNSSITWIGGQGTVTYGTVWFARGASTGDLLITDNSTFVDFKDTGTGAHSYKFTDGTINTTGGFHVSGDVSHVVTLTSLSTGLFTLRKTGYGQVSMDYMNVQHCLATPANFWYGGTHSTNNQGVSTAGDGVIFTAPPPQGPAPFFAMM